MAYKGVKRFRKGRKGGSQKVLTKKQVKAVAKIAKKVDLSNDEVKEYQRYFNDSGVMGIALRATSYNVGYYLSKGTEAYQRVGEKIRLRSITVSGVTRLQASSGASPIIHVAIIRTKKDTSGNLGTLDLLRSPNSGSGMPSLYEFDRSKVQVLAHKRIIFNLKASNMPTNAPFYLRANVNRVVDWGQNNSLPQGWNYYVVYYGDEQGNVGTSTGASMDCLWKVRYTDA